MPTVPNISSMIGAEVDRNNPTPEHLLMTAADMHARGQLTDSPTFQTPGASLKLPFHAAGSPRPHGKRR